MPHGRPSGRGEGDASEVCNIPRHKDAWCVHQRRPLFLWCKWIPSCQLVPLNCVTTGTRNSLPAAWMDSSMDWLRILEQFEQSALKYLKLHAHLSMLLVVAIWAYHQQEVWTPLLSTPSKTARFSIPSASSLHLSDFSAFHWSFISNFSSTSRMNTTLPLLQRMTPYISAVKNLCELYSFFCNTHWHYDVMVENPSIASHSSSIDRVT